MKCNKCGAEVAGNASFCEYCGQALPAQEKPVQSYEQPAAQPVVPQKKENVVSGVVGALIGAAIGVAAIVLVNQAGYVASICGLILAVCTVKGYELLGGKLGKVGTAICIAIMLLAPYVADRISWAIAIMQAFADEGVTFGDCFASVHEVIEASELTGDYFKDLGMLYLFTVLGMLSTMRGMFQKKK